MRGWLHKLTVSIGIFILDLYFRGRAVRFFPTNGRPILEGIARGARRSGNSAQIRIELPTDEMRWVSLRRGDRNDETGLWSFWDE